MHAEDQRKQKYQWTYRSCALLSKLTHARAVSAQGETSHRSRMTQKQFHELADIQ
jgi:hypothetical protein